ncbi:MAG: hypothetical protein J6J36_02480 [Clostridia bacterium]|nr:hypothetical protein [Clostridia bacterium]
MKFNSIDNFEVTIGNESSISIAKKNIEDIISPVEGSDSEENIKHEQMYEDEETISTVNSFLWGGTILISFVIWITCIVSLILNCTRKNVGKAVFAGIGLIVPIVAIAISTIGRSIYEIEENEIGTILVILALAVQFVVEIVAFAFCFSKKEKKKSI